MPDEPKAGRGPFRVIVSSLALYALLLGPAIASPASGERPDRAGGVGPAKCSGTHWVGVWSASPSDASANGSERIAGRTVRTVLTPLGNGSTLRLRLSNRLGSGPFVVRSASVGKQSRGATIQAGTLRTLRFGGFPAVTIAAHGTVVSDPVRLRFSALEHLAVTTYLGNSSTGLPTKHFDGRQTSYLSEAGTGDRTGDRSGDAFGESTTVRYLVSGVETKAPRSIGAVAAFGDSITDGYQAGSSRSAGIDRDARYPDYLARRLLPAAGDQRLSVLNAGIGGNRILRGPLRPAYGPSGLSRLDRDVVALPGVNNVIVLEGINDILQSDASGPDVIRGLTKVVARLKSAGLRVLLGTLTPTGGFSLSAPNRRAQRSVNHWIRGQRASDGVVDFDRALRDPQHPSRMLARYDSGDHLHPSSLGYRAMAAAVPLAQLRSSCATNRR